MKRSIASLAALGITLSTVSVAFAHVPFASAQDDTHVVKAPVQISIGNDTYMAGEEVRLTDSVNGNMNVAGGKVRVASTVDGDLQVAGGEVSVTGSVKDNMRVIGGNVSISGRVNGTLTVLAGEVHIEKTAVIGNMLVAGGSVTIDGTVNGMLKATAGEITLNGTANGVTDLKGDSVEVNGVVVGNATAAAQSLTVGDTAQFRGKLDYWSLQGKQDLKTRVKGAATFRDDLKVERHEAKAEGALALVAGITLFSLFSAAFLIGLLLFFTRNFFKEAAKKLEKQPWVSLLIGFLYVILTPIIVLILFLTFIGIPLAIALLLMYALSLFFGSVLTSMVFARWIEHKNKKKWNPVTIFFLSLGIFIVLKLLWVVPLLGWLAGMVAILMGLGSVITMKQEIYMKNR